jgi:transposase-like protein
VYQCTKCHKTFTKKQVEYGLAEIKKKRKKDYMDSASF